MDIGGTTWLVTGASAGIGEAIAREAAGHGARVIGVARRAEELGAVMNDIGGCPSSPTWLIARPSTG